MFSPIISQLSISSKNFPDKIAVIEANTQISYALLDQLSDRLACYLNACGAEREQMIVLCLNSGLLQIIAIIACFKANVAYVPIDVDQPIERIERIINDANPVLLIKDCDLDLKFDNQLVLDDYNDIEQFPLGYKWNKKNFQPHQLAYVIYTSGTSGEPKGVMVEHASLNNLLCSLEEFPCALNENDAFIQNVSYSFDPSLWTIFWPLLKGATLIIPQDKKDTALAASLIHEHKVRILHSGPTFLKLLLSEKNNELLQSIECVIGGGEAWEPSLLTSLKDKIPHSKLINVYGPTETTIHVTYWVSNDEPVNVLPIGKAISNCKILLLDEQNQIITNTNETGQIAVTGMPLARGYHNNPEFNDERFISNPFEDAPLFNRIYLTGDLGCWQPDGNLVFKGRFDEQVKIRGYRIQLEEIEYALSLYTGLTNYTAIDAHVHERNLLVAYVCGEHLDLLDLKSHCEQQLPAHMVPHDFVCLPALPVTANAKIDKAMLRKLYQESKSKDPLPEPCDDQKNVLNSCIMIWREVLQKPELDADANFMAQGGDSLAALDVVMSIEEKLGIDVELVDIFNNPTPLELSKCITEKGLMV